MMDKTRNASKEKTIEIEGRDNKERGAKRRSKEGIKRDNKAKDLRGNKEVGSRSHKKEE